MLNLDALYTLGVIFTLLISDSTILLLRVLCISEFRFFEELKEFMLAIKRADPLTLLDISMSHSGARKLEAVGSHCLRFN
jgi:hypothetical protein